MFDGWTPKEVHEHFDADGNRIGHTVITRESEWDDVTRERVMQLADYEDGLCGCGCGQPIEVASDPKRAFRVETYRCYATRAITKVATAEREKAEREKRPDGWDDGLHYYAVPIDLDDDN